MLTGATAQLPAATARIPTALARQMAGKTPAQIPGELGNETFCQRQAGKTRPTSYSRAQALERIGTWMHLVVEEARFGPTQRKDAAALRKLSEPPGSGFGWGARAGSP